MYFLSKENSTTLKKITYAWFGH